METLIQETIHAPIPMTEWVKKLTYKEIQEILSHANKEEEPGQTPDVTFYPNIYR